MTPEQQQIAIEKSCGGQRAGIKAPDYLNDLNAMHEAEGWLSGPQRSAFSHWLHKIVKGNLWGAFEIVHASAAQRAEAFLKTLNHWTPS